MSISKKQVLLIILATVIFTAASGSKVYAALSAKTVQAYQGIKIIYNGQELTDLTQPYVINNTTFVPIRMLMGKFGKNINWDAVNNQVLITDNSSSLETQLAQKDAQIKTLQTTISELNAKIDDLEDEIDNDDDTDIDEIEDTLYDYYEDAGDDYFDDDGIDVTISLSGDEDDLAYTIKLDFSDASDYDDLTDLNQSDIKSFLKAVTSRINSEIDGTDYEDADIAGKLVDDDNSSYYVKYNDGSYTFSWNDTDLSDIEDTLYDYFEDAGDDYFGDDGIDVSINLDGDEDELEYTIEFDFDDAYDYDDLTDLSTTKIKTFLNAVKSRINYEIDGTGYDGADIAGTLIDNNNSKYYVDYDDGTYTYSWDS